MIVISEIMGDPNDVSDRLGEWLELYNPSPDSVVDISGWSLSDLGGNDHVISPEASLTIQPHSYYVMARDSIALSDLGIESDYDYDGFQIANSADEIILTDSTGVIVDMITYLELKGDIQREDGLYNDDVIYKGASASLDPLRISFALNDRLEYWCRSVSEMSLRDRGTPGMPNDSCQ